MRWRVYLFRVMTGEVGQLLRQAEGGSWSISLNGIEDLSVTVLKEDLLKVNRDWWEEWKGGILVTFESEVNKVEIPLLANIITAPPAETQDTVTFSTQGLGALLEQRVVLAADYVGLSNTPTADEMKALAASTLSLKGRSLGTIMQDVVEYSTRKKIGGQLPIRYAVPREEASTLNERNYEGYNLSNNGTWKRLEELSAVINGPDFIFRPEWVEGDTNFIQWTLYHGTKSQPTIHQNWTMSIDTTAPKGPAGEIQVRSTFDKYANRVYWTGAGEGAGTLVRVAQDVNELKDYTPLIEYVGSTSESENGDLVQTHARSYLNNGRYRYTQVSVPVNVSTNQALLDNWHVGDAALVTVKGWLNLPDGTHLMRIISAKGTVGSPQVTIEFAEEVFHGQATESE